MKEGHIGIRIKYLYDSRAITEKYWLRSDAQNFVENDWTNEIPFEINCQSLYFHRFLYCTIIAFTTNPATKMNCLEETSYFFKPSLKQ